MLAVLLLTALLALALLLGAAFWWIRRENLAVVPVGRAPRDLRPLPTGCELGATLMAAAGPAGGGTKTGGGAPKRDVSHAPSRRAFLRNSWMVGTLGLLGGFGGATLAFLWPNLSGGFGAEIDVEEEATVLSEIRATRAPYPYAAGRMYLVEYDPALDPDGVYADATNGASVMALYQKCVHLGCTVPWCLTAQWFQCPCHGSNYNRWGEYEAGPAPRGLDRFPLRVENGRVLVNTAPAGLVTGPSRDTSVLQQPKEGPDCI